MFIKSLQVGQILSVKQYSLSLMTLFVWPMHRLCSSVAETSLILSLLSPNLVC